MTPETERALAARQARLRIRADRMVAKRAGGEPYTVHLTIQRTLEVPVELSDSCESAIASAVLLVHATDAPEEHYWSLVAEKSDPSFHVVKADAFPTRERPQE